MLLAKSCIRCTIC